MNRLSLYADQTYAALRVAAGLLFAYHGAQKLFGFYASYQPPLLSQIGLGAVIEFVGGLLIAVGVLTRPAAFLCSGTMAVAYVQFHWKLAFGRNFFPAENKGELALLYAFVFLYLACRGSGRYAVEPD